MSKPRYFVKADEVETYSPANHTGTVNRRLIGPKETGSQHLEVLLGTLTRKDGGAALPHSHPENDQACYMVSGRARAEIGGESAELGPGDACFFPAGQPHAFTVLSDEVKVLVIYTPPYLERGAVRHESV